MLKQSIRANIKTQLFALSKVDIASKSLGIIENLDSISLLTHCQSVGIFIPTPKEPQILPWALAAYQSGMHIYAPKIGENGQYQFQPTSLESFEKNPDNILESTTSSKRDYNILPEVILVPGQAFDRMGHRIGRGKGHYDMLLNLLPNTPIKIGLCFSEQLLNHVPSENHDIPMDIVITEKQTYLTGSFFDSSI
jgi:5-formyltetrahydrofolate cyclo-ligase